VFRGLLVWQLAPNAEEEVEVRVHMLEAVLDLFLWHLHQLLKEPIGRRAEPLELFVSNSILDGFLGHAPRVPHVASPDLGNRKGPDEAVLRGLGFLLGLHAGLHCFLQLLMATTASTLD